MNTMICFSALLIAQVQVPPIENPPVQTPPAQNPPQQGQNNLNQKIPNGTLPVGSFGTMYQMPVDGTYQILAYEKYGQILPGMNTLKVVIRNNILIFPGDGKLPGKMIQLAFGPGNTIMLTPLDGRADPTRPNPWQNPGDTPPTAVRNNNPNMSPPGVSQAGMIQPSAQSEMGVYVLSSEFFAISVTGKPPINDPIQPRPGDTQPPVNPQPPNVPRTITPPVPVQPPNVPRTITPPGSSQPPIGNTGVLPQPSGNNPVQQPATATTPPGAPNQAVLVLRRIAG